MAGTTTRRATDLRGGISDVANTLNKVRNASTDVNERRQIQRILNVLFTQWEEVIRININHTTAQYKKALKDLGTAEKASKDALEDIHKTAKAIQQATRAAKAVDKIVKLFVGVFV